MISKQIHLFATRQDLEPGIRHIEQRHALKYVLCGMRSSPDARSWRSLLDVETLGKAAAGNQSLCERFLVLKANAELRIRSVAQASGETRYAIDQLENPISLVCQLGGIFNDGFLICSHIGTASNHADSVQLFREFSASLTDGFQKCGKYFVGTKALELQHSGVRLITMHVAENEEYDLNP